MTVRAEARLAGDQVYRRTWDRTCLYSTPGGDKHRTVPRRPSPQPRPGFTPWLRRAPATVPVCAALS